MLRCRYFHCKVVQYWNRSEPRLQYNAVCNRKCRCCNYVSTTEKGLDTIWPRNKVFCKLLRTREVLLRKVKRAEQRAERYIFYKKALPRLRSNCCAQYFGSLVLSVVSHCSLCGWGHVIELEAIRYRRVQQILSVLVICLNGTKLMTRGSGMCGPLFLFPRRGYKYCGLLSTDRLAAQRIFPDKKSFSEISKVFKSVCHTE